MATFLISYDTHYARNYDRLYTAFDKHGIGRVLESVWIGELDNTHDQVRDWVRNLLDDDDSILIIEMKPKHSKAWRNLPDDVVKWLKALV
ncbi:MAG: hypothetical protein ACFB6R_03565 [Alphaproteobacteria bacterium]